MKNSLLVFLFVLSGISTQAQELNCKVDVVTDAALEVTTVEKEIFDQLKQTIFELMNQG
jgi:hypothetical protein